jgi:hypothetical protein
MEMHIIAIAPPDVKSISVSRNNVPFLLMPFLMLVIPILPVTEYYLWKSIYIELRIACLNIERNDKFPTLTTESHMIRVYIIIL